MTANLLPSIFTIEISGTPTLTFEAQNLREAHELCHEQWLKDDLAQAKSDGVPLWDGKATLRARMALPDESAVFARVFLVLDFRLHRVAPGQHANSRRGDGNVFRAPLPRYGNCVHA